MEQCLQHAESAPIGHAFIFAARSKQSSTPSFLAFFIIWAVASQMVTSLVSRILLTTVFDFCSGIISSLNF